MVFVTFLTLNSDNPKKMKCQLCGFADSLVEVLDLGRQPICNAVLSEEELSSPETRYPLVLSVCEKCFLVQLSTIIPQEIVFSDKFNYLSGTNKMLVRHFETLALEIVERFQLIGLELVCDIGSNDGSFLDPFKRRGLRVLGIEPTALPAKVANDKGISTIKEFLSPKLAKNIVSAYGTPRVVTAMNVLAHNDNIHSFLESIRELMNDESIFISQSHYLPPMIEHLEYDMVYHEHLRYYTLDTLRQLFEAHDLFLVDTEFNSIHGGSILTYCTTKRAKLPRKLQRTIENEARYQQIQTYTRFAKRVQKSKFELVRLLQALRREGKEIVGIGAPMKASTLLNYCQIGPDLLSYLTEVNQLKIGKFTPGVHIPIIDENLMFERQPNYALILSWTIAEDIMNSLRSRGFLGGFIVPIPSVRVIGLRESKRRK
jgi:hypothetical protein